MAKNEKVLRGNNLWDKLDGKKEELKETVQINFGGIQGEVTVVYRDINDVIEAEQEVFEDLSEKPVVEFKGLGKIEVPNDEYPQFNDHKKAQEWEEENKPVRRRATYRRAYEFIADDEKPSDDPKEGTDILERSLRYMDAIQIVNKGMELAGLDRQLDDARKNS